MKAHGAIHYQWINNVLVSVSEGDLNAEGADEVGREFAALMAAKPQAEWAALSLNQRSQSLLTPQAIEPLRAFLGYAAAQGMRHSANVNASSVQDAIAETLFDGMGIEQRVFHDLEAAVSWLQDCGYSLSLSDLGQLLSRDSAE